MFAVTLAAGQQQPEQDIMARLLPDENPHRVVKVDPAQRDEVVKELRAAQKTATGARAVEIAFLLAAFDANYAKNRDYLIDNLRGCTTSAVKSGCDGNIAEYLLALYEQGHKDVLKPLMLIGKDSYSAAGAVSLGRFLSSLIADDAAEFFDAIRRLPAETQSQLCDLAGMGYGDGLPADRLQRILKELKARGDEVSLTCLQAIEAASKQ